MFTNQKLQALYGQMVKQRSFSLVEAFKTCATIEDLEIYHLKNVLTYVVCADIQLVSVYLHGTHVRIIDLDKAFD